MTSASATTRNLSGLDKAEHEPAAPLLSPLQVSPTAKPRLLLTLGDPAGIGPEVVLKALSNSAFLARADISVIGDRTLVQNTYTGLKASCPNLVDLERLNFIDIGLSRVLTSKVVTGAQSPSSGEVSFRTLESAIALTLQGEFDGIVTAPIAKSAWLAAGHAYPGQTELLAEMSNTRRFGMLFVAKSPQNGWSLRTLLATTHIPLKDVPQVLTPEVMTLKLELLIECLQRDFGLSEARIAIAGLNPHSGEQGQLGREEQDWLIPWLAQQQQRFPHIQLEGPIPPDTMWVAPGQAWHSRDIAQGETQNGAHQNKAHQNRAHDGYLALYHDQGLIPVKLLAFDLAVNTTIGLPFIRTSPDHGTAFNIAGKGIARSESTEAALDLAIELVTQRLSASKQTQLL